MRKLLLLVVIHVITRPVLSMNGIIWDKKSKDFVSIYNIPAFAAWNQELLNRSLEKETYNFQGKVIRLSYFKVPNVITTGNDTKITGAIGDIWNTLSEYLNFTLKPTVIETRTLGFRHDNGTFTDGLLKIILNNETDVIPRVEAMEDRLDAAQFSVPLWRIKQVEIKNVLKTCTSYQLTIRKEKEHVLTWMLKLFSQKVWIATLTTYFLLSFSNYLAQTMNSNTPETTSVTTATLHDHLFYNFGIICGQSYMPTGLSKSSKIVELWLGLFSCLLRTAFGALLVVYMTQLHNSPPPIDSFESIFNRTSYILLMSKGSLHGMRFQFRNDGKYIKYREMKRVEQGDNREEMYKMLCSTKKPYAMLEGEDLKQFAGFDFCEISNYGLPINHLSIVSAISRNFTYKRSIDMGIIKMHEVGIIQRFKHRWTRTSYNEEAPLLDAEPLVINKLYLIFYICGGAVLISFATLMFETFMFNYNN